jgi:phosphoribosyl-ATP pyrophosphohydrolase
LFAPVHSGDFVRKLTKVGTDENVVAPHRLDGMVKDLLFSSVETYGHVVAEAFPRNLAQVGWIGELLRNGVAVSVVRTVCPTNIRVSRVRARDMHDGARYDLDITKIRNEGDDYSHESYFASILDGVMHTVIDTSQCATRVSVPDSGHATLDGLLTLSNAFFRRKAGYKPIDESHIAERCIEELEEFQEKLRHQPVQILAANEELIDVMFFLFTLMKSRGMSARAIADLAAQKFTVNNHRLETGNKPHVSNT